jgi:hypothetical protein
MTDIVETSATDNAEIPVVESQVTTPEVAVVEESKPLSLHDAITKAFEKHTPEVSTTDTPVVAAPTEPDKAIDPITGRTVEPIKPPVSLTPALREKWASVDPQFQKFWTDREKDMAQKLSSTADERKLAQEFKDVVAPYEPMFRQFNTTATEHVKELMTLSHTLNTGTPEIKARVLYNLINHFKPDPTTLQQLFAGQPVQTQAAPPPVNVQAEVQRILDERTAAEQKAQTDTAITTFANNPANEFYEDVRELMGKVINAGLVNGTSMDEVLKNAYDMACQQHPEVKQVLAGRATTTQAAATTATPVKSIKPSLGSGRSAAKPAKSMSIDDAVKTAMKQHGVLQ